LVINSLKHGSYPFVAVQHLSSTACQMHLGGMIKERTIRGGVLRTVPGDGLDVTRIRHNGPLLVYPGGVGTDCRFVAPWLALARK
jgi:hypothetical protein